VESAEGVSLTTNGDVGMRIEQQVETYNQNGWVVVEDLLSSEEVAVLSQRADEIILGEKFPEVSVQCVQIEPDMKEQIEAGMIPRTEAIRTLRGVAEHDDLFHTHVRNEKILDIAQAIVGPDAVSWEISCSTSLLYMAARSSFIMRRTRSGHMFSFPYW
jgi:hypothetical protein